MTLAQSVQLDAAVIVTTPHQLSLTDVRKGILMFDRVDVPVIGVIENMAWFMCDQCDKKHELFGESGGEALESQFGLATLAQLPLTSVLGEDLASATDTQLVSDATDAVVRALGQQALKKVAKPSVSFDGEAITLRWEGGDVVRVANRALRLACGCALCIDEMTRHPILDADSVATGICAEEVRIIGNYAIGVTWSDGHSTGFFPYKAIRRLAEDA